MPSFCWRRPRVPRGRRCTDTAPSRVLPAWTATHERHIGLHDGHTNRMLNRGYRLTAAAVICLFGALAPVRASAQPSDVPPGPLTLEQVLTLAEARSESIAISHAGVERA